MYPSQIKIVCGFAFKLKIRLNGDQLNYQVMTSSSSSHSAEALSDPMPRIYSCFCEKLFTTYPGIYLHLKSKHGHLFQKYKRLKITKLFKKVRDQKGNEIYKLDRLSDKDMTSTYSTQKIIKESKKNTEQDRDFKEAFPMDRFNEVQRKNHHSYFNPNARKETQNFPFQNDFKKNFQSQMDNIRSYPSPFMNFPMGMPMPPFPQMFSNYPPLFPDLKMTTKKLLQKFLLEIETVDKLVMKKYLYNLMVFIDRNSDNIEDPRSKFKLFLSYCDQFDPKFVGPTIHQYVGILKAQLREPETAEDEARKKEKEIECITAFGNWLNEMGMTKFQEKVPMVPYEEKKSQKEPMQVKTSMLKLEREAEQKQCLGEKQKVVEIDIRDD